METIIEAASPVLAAALFTVGVITVIVGLFAVNTAPSGASLGKPGAVMTVGGLLAVIGLLLLL